MSIYPAVDALVEEFRATARVVIVGASLAGLRAAEALREEGFDGHMTIIGDEPYEPYDRPPLSKQVLKGVPADHTKLPRVRMVNNPSSAASAGLNQGLAREPVAISSRSYGIWSPLARRTCLAARSSPVAPTPSRQSASIARTRGSLV